METPHKFEPQTVYSRLCTHCGREVNDYKYHFTEATNVRWSAPSPAEQAITNAGKVIYYICHHLTGLKFSHNYCEPCKLAMCEACAVAHKHQPGVMRAQAMSEITVRDQGRAKLIEWLLRAPTQTIADRIEALEKLLRVLVVADEREGSQDAFGYIAVGVAKEARELLK